VMLIFFQNISFLYLLVLLLSVLLLLNFGFFKFIGCKKRPLYLLKVIPIFYLDMLSSFLGTMLGVVDYSLFDRKY